ncbi:MAG TPA: hypothetical protein PKE65_05910 [Rhizobiaceae bacterium]|nr:hypothetical protein [Rhizobiaceae bacterium]
MMLAAAALLVSSLTQAADEKDWLHFPDMTDFRTQRISRQPNEANWPFTVDEGMLLCARGFGQRIAMFAEIPDGDAGFGDDTGAEDNAVDDGANVSGPRVVVLTVDPFDLAFGPLGVRSLLDLPTTPEGAIRRIAPFVTQARKLCDQPRGAEIGGGEL